jgi:hypothetical protein
MNCPLNLVCCKEFVIHDELGRLQIVGANQCLQVPDFGSLSVLRNQITSSQFPCSTRNGTIHPTRSPVHLPG